MDVDPPPDTNRVNYTIFTPDTAVNDHMEYNHAGVKLTLDVHDFKPNEIRCQVSKLLLEVVAESNRIGRCKLSRKYVMPQNVAAQNCDCRINKEGVMCIFIPWEIQGI